MTINFSLKFLLELVIFLTVFEALKAQNSSNQTNGTDIIITRQPVRIMYKSETRLNCTLWSANDSSTYDNVTFYRYASNDVNRTKPLKIEKDPKMYGFDVNSTNILIIKSPKRTEIESTYFCNGTSSNQTIVFIFQVLPFIYIPSEEKISSTETTDVEMSCQVLFGNDPSGMQWSWLRNRVLVNATERIKITVANGSTWQSTLSIKEIRLQEAGLYECVVANKFGSNSQIVQVNVRSVLSPLWPFLGVIGEIIVFVFALKFCPTPVKKYVPKIQ